MKLCQRFGCLPSQLFREDAALLRYVHLADLGRVDDGRHPDGELGAVDEFDPL